MTDLQSAERIVQYFTYRTLRKFPFLDKEDVSQEFRVEAWLALQQFDAEKGSYAYFVSRHLNWRMLDLFKSTHRKRSKEDFYSDEGSNIFGTSNISDNLCEFNKIAGKVIEKIKSSFRKTQQRDLMIAFRRVLRREEVALSSLEYRHIRRLKKVFKEVLDETLC